MKERASGPDGGAAGGIETEEIDTGLALVCDVGADVEFGEGGYAGDWRKVMGANAAHAEGHDSEPALAFEGVERKSARHVRAYLLGWNGPVGEEEFVPGLLHDPGAAGQGPRTVRDRLQERVHEVSLARWGVQKSFREP